MRLLNMKYPILATVRQISGQMTVSSTRFLPVVLGMFAGWCWCWFGLAGAGFFERKTLLAGWFGLAETNK